MNSEITRKQWLVEKIKDLEKVLLNPDSDPNKTPLIIKDIKEFKKELDELENK